MRIMCSGGHLTPAYSFGEIVSKNKDILFIVGSGGKNAREISEFRQLGFKYYSIKKIKYDRHNKIISILKMPLVVFSILQCVMYIKKLKIDVVVTFGGYNSVPLGIAAYVSKIPLIIHEQTRSIGLANKVLAPIADFIALSYEDSKKYVGRKNYQVIGNLVRSLFWESQKNISLHIPTNKPIIYITGGNQGSQFILNKIDSLLPQLTTAYQLVIQSGNVDITTFNQNNLKDVCIQSWFSATQVAYLMQHAHIIISRGGANTISEIMVTGIPNIIVPLPGTQNDEQLINAHQIEKSGAGIVLPQSECSKEKLHQSIIQIEKEYSKYSDQAKIMKSKQNPKSAEILYKKALELSRKY